MSRFALSRKEEDSILSLCRTEALKACQAEVSSESALRRSFSRLSNTDIARFERSSASGVLRRLFGLLPRADHLGHLGVSPAVPGHAELHVSPVRPLSRSNLIRTSILITAPPTACRKPSSTRQNASSSERAASPKTPSLQPSDPQLFSLPCLTGSFTRCCSALCIVAQVSRLRFGLRVRMRDLDQRGLLSPPSRPARLGAPRPARLEQACCFLTRMKQAS